MSSDAARVCENCGTELAGPFCYQCGQRAHRFGSLWQFVRGSLDFDSRTLRTLARLFTSPGTLTREFLAGRRVPYMQPFQVYLLAAAVFFLVNSFRPFVRVDLETRQIRSSLSIASAAGDIGPDEVQQLAARGISLDVFKERFQNTVQQNLPTFMIGSIVLFALTLALFYIFSNRNLLAHIIFSLHWCAFYLLLMVLERLVSRGTSPNAVGTILAVIALVYLTLALRRVHGQSWLLTILKSCALFLVFNAILALWVVSVMLVAYRFEFNI